MKIKISDLRAMARILYAAVAAYRAHELIEFERLAPNTKDAYLRMARIALTELHPT